MRDYSLMNIGLHGTEFDNVMFGALVESFFKALGMKTTACITSIGFPREKHSRWKLIWMLLRAIFRPYKWKPVYIKSHSPDWEEISKKQLEKAMKTIEGRNEN